MISLPKRKEESKEKTPVVVAAPPPVKVMVSGGIKAVSPKKLKKVAAEVVHNRNTRSQQKGPIKMIQVEPKQNKQRKRLVK